ncbi:MAG TPA: TIGR00266 family protein [Anaerolineales bacterium]|nr:TIGR00266 family protein [Anaerolineales bacterium]
MMSIPDLPTVPEVSGQTKSGLKYHILGTVQQTLAVELQPNQTVYSDAGAMSWMTTTVNMSTTTGGGLGGMLKRAVSGATAFIINFNATGAPGQAAFSTDFPGKVLPIELEAGQSVILHKHAFLCAEKSVGLDVFFTRKLGAGFFGGEGFILQKLTGPGMAFAELDGDAVEYNLKAGEVMKVEPGHVAMFEGSVGFDIQMIKGIANILAGGEGLFLATLSGPGRIWLHSMTVSKMAHRLMEYMPAKTS